MISSSQEWETSPYGVFAITPELQAGEDFLDDYTLAFELGRGLDSTRGARPEEIGQIIRNAVNESLGPNVTSARVLAVAALTAEARVRYLR